MDVANMHFSETFSLSDFSSANGMPARCCRKIFEVEMGIEGKKAVRDFRIQTSNRTGYGSDFPPVRIVRLFLG